VSEEREELKLTPTESVRILAADPEALLVEAAYLGGPKPPPKHFHPNQDEHFEVLEGSLRFRLGDEERTLEQGAEIEIPRGTVHQVWNLGPDPARVAWRTSPAGRTEQWFRAIDRVHREGRVDSKGMPGPLAFGVMLSEYRDTFRLGGPDWLLRPALGLLGEIGRRRGYRA
jgi:mannose-6-phosphate isomerase-like protein (cupin superfamily)